MLSPSEAALDFEARALLGEPGLQLGIVLELPQLRQDAVRQRIAQRGGEVQSRWAAVSDLSDLSCGRSS